MPSEAYRRLIAAAGREKSTTGKRRLITQAQRLKLREDVTGCHACPLRELSGMPRPYVFKGPSPALLAIFHDSPTKADIAPNQRSKTTLAPNTIEGKRLAWLLDEIGLTRDEVWIDSATKCAPFGVLGNAIRLDVDKPTSPPRSVEETVKLELALELDAANPGHVSQTCIDLYAKRALKLSGARVVLCLGEGGLRVGKALGGFKATASYQACRDMAPKYTGGGSGPVFVCSWDLPTAVRHASRMSELRHAFQTCGELIQLSVDEYARELFAGSEIVSCRTYDQLVDEVLGVLSVALKGLPPARSREKLIGLLERVVDAVHAIPGSERKPGHGYAVRVLKDLENGKIVWPKVGYLAKGNE